MCARVFVCKCHLILCLCVSEVLAGRSVFAMSLSAWKHFCFFNIGRQIQSLGQAEYVARIILAPNYVIVDNMSAKVASLHVRTPLGALHCKSCLRTHLHSLCFVWLTSTATWESLIHLKCFWSAWKKNPGRHREIRQITYRNEILNPYLPKISIPEEIKVHCTHNALQKVYEVLGLTFSTWDILNCQSKKSTVQLTQPIALVLSIMA